MHSASDGFHTEIRLPCVLSTVPGMLHEKSSSLFLSTLSISFIYPALRTRGASASASVKQREIGSGANKQPHSHESCLKHLSVDSLLLYGVITRHSGSEGFSTVVYMTS
jgi:hypothetical protein